MNQHATSLGTTSLGTTSLGTSTCLGKSTLVERPDFVYDPRLDDCVLSCSDGVRVPANTYAMVTSCSVLAMFFDDMPPGERVFYVDVPSNRVRPFVDLVHNKRQVAEYAHVQDIADTLDLMDYLGCTAKWRKLVHKLWSLLRAESPEVTGPVLMEHAQYLLPEFGSGYLHKLRLVYPHWSDFSRVFDHLVITSRLAVVLVETLARFFPIGVLVDAISRYAADTHRTEIVQHLLSIRRLGAMFHPDEFTWTVRRLPYMPILDCVRDAFSVVNRPLGSKIRSSMLTYPTRNTCSFFFMLEDVTKRTTVSFSGNVATVMVDPGAETLFVGVNMDKLGETASIALTAYVRLTVFDEVETPHGRALDVWQDVEVDEHGMWSARFERVPLGGPWAKLDVFWLHDPRIC